MTRDQISRRVVSLIALVFGLLGLEIILHNFDAEIGRALQSVFEDLTAWLMAMPVGTRTIVVLLAFSSVATAIAGLMLHVIRMRGKQLSDHQLDQLDEEIHAEKRRRQVNRLLSTKRTEEPMDSEDW